VTATGGRGGGSGAGSRGAVVSGPVSVTPGQTLYVEVGGVGGIPTGGFNGGGTGGSRNGLSASGGGGASDVRTVSRASSGTLSSRLIVAGGGGGAIFAGVGGGNAGQPGTGCCSAGPSLVPAVGGGAGTKTAGGAGGCTLGGTGCGVAGCSGDVSCGADGDLGVGGDGGSVGDAAATREGSGGGGGLYGGGGGGAVAGLFVGSGGGGSSLVPARGLQTLAAITDPPSIVISTKVPKYLALQIPVSMCFDAGAVTAGTHIADVSYIDKGAGDRHLEMVGVTPVPVAAGSTFTAAISGTQFATFTLDSTGNIPSIDLTGSAVPALVDGNATVEIGFPAFGGLIVASSSCGG
jgi:adhesin/invasin